MKTKITFLAALFVIMTVTSFATVRTVSNLPLGGSQYPSLMDAYNASSDGDTLILEGTNIEYHLDYYTIWSKQLTVLGGGLNTDKENFKKTYIRHNNSRSEFRMGAGSGSSFFGITFTSRILFFDHISNISFENCEFNGGDYGESFNTQNVTVSGLVFRNCIFGLDNGVNLSLGTTSVTSAAFFNCVFDGYIRGYNNSLNVLMFDHCLFLGTNTPVENLHTATISNSIFMNVYPTSTTNCTYLNNICRVAGTFPPAGNFGSGNIENSDPQLVNYTFGSFYSPAHDYDIQASSPCELAATDGTDIGVHGGTSNFSEKGEALIAPVVRSVLVTNPVVAPNGTLNVEVTATTPAID